MATIVLTVIAVIICCYFFIFTGNVQGRNKKGRVRASIIVGFIAGLTLGLAFASVVSMSVATRDVVISQETLAKEKFDDQAFYLIYSSYSNLQIINTHCSFEFVYK